MSDCRHPQQALRGLVMLGLVLLTLEVRYIWRYYRGLA